MRRMAWLLPSAVAALLAGSSLPALAVLPGPAAATAKTFSVSVSDSNPGETAGEVTVTVTRSTTKGKATVHLATTDGTATAPDDYTSLDETLTFTKGDTITRQVSIVNDTIAEPNETFTVGLGVPTSKYSLATASQTVTIAANDWLYGGGFSAVSTIYIPASGKATPYPSTITVSGLGGTITDVNVTLLGFNHTAPGDVEVLLVGPGAKVLLFTNCGGPNDVSAVGLTFDDAANGYLPESSATSQITTGTYKPSSYTPVSFGSSAWSPAPTGPYGSAMSAFNGTAPNGSWSLYVIDKLSGDYGNFSGGWELTLITAA